MDNMQIRNAITEHVERRAGYLISILEPLLQLQTRGAFRIAGGALVGKINDLDIFPAMVDKQYDLPAPLKSLEIISQTKNATTYKADPYPLQLCKYEWPTLRDLVESFDYAHIQVGVEYEWREGRVAMAQSYFTDAFIVANACHATRFLGSEYPLSSLLRAAKYWKRGDMSRGVYLRETIAALVAVIQRGFHSYDDFKDQLDAVDLGLVPEDLGELSTHPLTMLFMELRRDAER